MSIQALGSTSKIAAPNPPGGESRACPGVPGAVSASAAPGIPVSALARLRFPGIGLERPLPEGGRFPASDRGGLPDSWRSDAFRVPLATAAPVCGPLVGRPTRHCLERGEAL